MRRNWLSFIFKYFTKIIFAAVLLSLMTLNVNTLRGSQKISEDEDYQAWCARQRQLKENMRRVCQKYGKLVESQVNIRWLIYEPDHKLLFCRNAKAGSTTWLAHFLQLYRGRGKSQKIPAELTGLKDIPKDKPIRVLHDTVPNLFKLESLNGSSIEALAEQTISFSMVRHPFERLVSAYQDKLIDQNYEGYRDYITANFGPVSFKTFVQMVIMKSKKRCQKLNQCHLDRHWQPFISRCGYCNLNYKVISKSETFNEDRKFIGKLADVDFETLETHISSGGTSRERAMKYFSELRLETVKKLYEVYKVDFELFGYSPQLYYDFAIH